MKRVALMALLVGSSCFKPWSLEALYACDSAGACSDGMTCDDGVCCRPGGTPACPTLPVDGRCDGQAPQVFFEDKDTDGFGNPQVSRGFCRLPVRTSWATNNQDCDDTKSTVKPTGLEVCNGRDDDCDGVIDDGLMLNTWFYDADHDGFGAPDASVRACVAIPLADGGSDYVARGGDCRTDDALVFPGAKERCNNQDDNCNGQVDEGNFSDGWNQGDPLTQFACATGGQGECSAGNTRCVRSLNDTYSLQCVPQKISRAEVCGDAIDSDCDGQNDNAPGCGGPTSLVQASATFGAVRLKVAGLDAMPQNLGRCLQPQYQADGGRPMSWLNPSWVTTNSLSADANDVAPFEVHLWWAQAPTDDVWDLSKPGNTLALAFTQQQVGTVTGGFWQPDTRVKQPVVSLCDANGQLLRQYRPTGTQFINDQALTPLLLEGAGNGWAQVAGSGSLKAVRSVEIVVSNRSPSPSEQTATMTLKFAPTAGFR